MYNHGSYHFEVSNMLKHITLINYTLLLMACLVNCETVQRADEVKRPTRANIGVEYAEVPSMLRGTIKQHVALMGYSNTYKDSSVHAFIDKKTGQVYMPAGYNKPTLTGKYPVRWDLRIIKDREYILNPFNCGWAGGYLYDRSTLPNKYY